MNSVVKIERLRKPTKPTICYHCSQFYHTASNCNNPPKCAGPHAASECCQKFWGEKAKFPSCQGNHVTSFSGCPKNPANIKKEKKKQRKCGCPCYYCQSTDHEASKILCSHCSEGTAGKKTPSSDIS